MSFSPVQGLRSKQSLHRRLTCGENTSFVFGTRAKAGSCIPLFTWDLEVWIPIFLNSQPAMEPFKQRPEAFFELVVHDIDSKPGLTGACAGYEQGRFRNDGIADYLFEWLPEFALKYSELEEFNSGTAMRLVKQAAKTVYNTEKYKQRGEFGELILHALLREVFKSEPAISKIYYKSAVNDPVKGFDAVHIVENAQELELWLGEVKFYKDGQAAIREIIAEIKDHTEADYLKQEFILIGTKLDRRWKYFEQVKDLISQRKSLDDVFTRLCIPALITYESECVASHDKVSDDFREKLGTEIRNLAGKFSASGLPALRVHLFLVPLHQKEHLVTLLHDKLEGLQK